MEVNHQKLKWVIKKMYEKKLPLYIWGSMGIGKSRIVRETAMEIAKEKGLKFSDSEFGEDIFTLLDKRMSETKDPSELKGLPFPNSDRTKTSWLPTEDFPDYGQGIMFLDELNLAIPIVQSACYELILDRKLGNKKLPDGFLVIGAGNLSTDQANTFDMAKPLANRFNHVELRVPTTDEWINWAINNNIDSRILSFLQFKPSYLYKYKEDLIDVAFATPRTWEMCSKLIEGEVNNENLQILAGASVGSGVGYEFASFLKLSESINIEDILKNPSKINDIKEISMKYSLLGATGGYYQKKNTIEVLEQILKVCEVLEPEFGVLMIKILKSVDGNKLQKRLEKTKSWPSLARRYSFIM